MWNLTKHAWRLLTRHSLLGRLLTRWETLGPGRPNLLRILVYHRIDEPHARPELDPTLLSAGPAAFDEQMRFLVEHYRVVSLAEVLEAVRRRRRLAPRSVLVTFDDGYQDFADHAWPVLRRYGVPATLFVPTGYPGSQQTFWWDRLFAAITSAGGTVSTPFGRLRLTTPAERLQTFGRLKTRLKRLSHAEATSQVEEICAALNMPALPNRLMGWDTLRQLAAEGLTLALHTHSHALLDRIDLREVADEVCRSTAELVHEIGIAPPVLAYPAGRTDESVIRTLRRLGIAMGLTVGRGINDLRTADPLRLRRIPLGMRTPLNGLRIQLLPWR